VPSSRRAPGSVRGSRAALRPAPARRVPAFGLPRPLPPSGRGSARAAPLRLGVITFPKQPAGGAREGGREPGPAAHPAPRDADAGPEARTNFASRTPRPARGAGPRSCPGKCSALRRCLRTGAGKMEGTGTGRFGLVRGSGARAHAHTLPRAHTPAHTPAHTRRECGDPGRGSHPCGAGGGGGGGTQLPGPRAPLSRPPSAAGPGLRRARADELRAAGSAATGRGVCAATLSAAGSAAGAARGGWGRARRRGEAAPGHVCPARGEERAPPGDRPRAPPSPGSVTGP
jgi:hypothetical protein